MLNIGIIGTAGRQEDQKKISRELYIKLCKDVIKRIEKYQVPIRLVSGGAAFADHSAVSLYLLNKSTSLRLYFPATFIKNQFEDLGQGSAGAIANYYHLAFSKKMQQSSLEDLQKVIEKGAEVIVNKLGFKARNLQVATDVEILFAYTFGEGNSPKADSGTYHTWLNSTATEKYHIPLLSL